MNATAVDCVVIGAGVVGLACARALAQAGREVLILERAAGFGQGVSSRSSEVLHSGLYYPSGSLKARCCVRGQSLLYAYCAERGIAHRRTGKLVVATHPAQAAALDQLTAQAVANGVTGLQRLDAAAAARLEPALHCEGALWVADTGIIDSHALMLSLLGDAEAAGASFVPNTPVRMRRTGDGCLLETPELLLAARTVVNAAGLGALPLAREVGGLALPDLQPPYACGNYFALSGHAPFSRLVYPLPEPGGLGIHLTLDLGGQARFGPDVQWREQEDYVVDEARKATFVTAIRRYWPELPEAALQPAYVGIRPKLHGPAEAAVDFRMVSPAEHGIPGLWQLLGIESPGLTACLALAETLCTRLAGEA